MVQHGCLGFGHQTRGLSSNVRQSCDSPVALGKALGLRSVGKMEMMVIPSHWLQEESDLHKSLLAINVAHP